MSAEAGDTAAASMEKLSLDDKASFDANGSGPSGNTINTSVTAPLSHDSDAVQTPSSAVPGGSNQPHSASLYVGELDPAVTEAMLFPSDKLHRSVSAATPSRAAHLDTPMSTTTTRRMASVLWKS